MRKILFPIIVLLAMSGSLLAQDIPHVTLAAEVKPTALKKGEQGEMVITCQVREGFHISAASSNLFSVRPKAVAGIRFGDAVYPIGEEEEYVGYVYRGKIEVSIPITIMGGALEGENVLISEVAYQSCDESSGVCFAPTTESVQTAVTVEPGKGVTPPQGIERGGIAGRLDRSLAQGSWVAILIVFLGGLLTSFTPCVYPMIPITIAVIGAQATGGKLKGFILSLFYVLGIAITFTSLGVIAAKTGGLFGAFAQHPIAVILIASIFFLMGLSMLGVFVMQLPASVATKLQGKKRSGFLGAMLTGLVAGLIVSPCISPILVVILTWVAQTGSVMLGIGLLASFSLGLGVLFILIGTFSGVLRNLPKSGGWMEIIERAFGVLLVGLAIIFLKPLLPMFIYLLVWALFLIITGTFIGGFSVLDHEATRQKKLGKALGIAAVVVGACLVFFAFSQWFGLSVGSTQSTSQVSIEKSFWINSEEAGFQAAKAQNKLVLLDFTADYCTACHELEEKTWPDLAVRAEMQRFIPIQLDLSKTDDVTKRLQQKYSILGMPTIIILTAAGEELGRFEGFKPPEEVVQILQKF